MYQSKFSSDISNTGRSMGHGIYTSDVVKKVWPTETAINHPFWGWKHTHLWSSCCHGLPFTCLCHRQILVEQEDNYMDISWFRYRWTATFFVDLYPYSFYIYMYLHLYNDSKMREWMASYNQVQHNQWRFTAWGFTTSYSIDICNCVHTCIQITWFVYIIYILTPHHSMTLGNMPQRETTSSVLGNNWENWWFAFILPEDYTNVINISSI